ncbi:MAG TPA: helix-turn-helix domain-containing protein [Ktedonobacterales bacterium]|jgi:transposase|nr:helix-turn-helix domain-containing protein [Ktedonobacterales bacterium]
MRPPIFVRTLSEAERQALEKGLRSKDAFVLHRCQMLLASARGERAPRIAEPLGCDDQTVLDALHAFNATGLQALQKKSARAHRTRLVFAPEQAERLRVLLHCSPRDFGKPTSVWTLALAAEVSVEEGIVAARVSGETIRQTLLRLGLSWERAKHWITSPDPAYARKKGGATA